ncbi:hypothetical protein [Bartonella sp. HY761]|uniref:hypothetical protein n=1 Tax=Bartonella sp. HY761 TaxID=2979330 RepID=UPI0021FBC562|nr:hypothetical protein [Bartonella sp. HY761]UXN07521.1 hypothetical protein N6A79_05925 [Bartonella sp. HY761]
MSTKPDLTQIEIFRPGTFHSMEGEDVVITNSDLQNIASRYDASFDAPIVIGHPENDMPAYGWVKGLTFDESKKRLVADVDITDEDFKRAVKAQKFKKISASFFAPDAPANPKPGHLYLRHVGFLGAAAPAVHGLKSVQFAGAKNRIITLNFSENKMSLLDRLKDFIANKIGPEQSNDIFNDDDFEKLIAEDEADKAQEALADVTAAPAVEEPKAEAIADNPNAEDEDEKKNEASFSSLRQREAALAKRENAVKAQALTLVHQGNLSFAEGLVKAGKILPKQREDIARVLDSVAQSPSNISFSDGRKKNAATALKDILRELPRTVSFGETVPPEEKKEAASFNAPDNFETDPERLELYEKAKAYQLSHPDVDFASAVQAVEGTL